MRQPTKIGKLICFVTLLVSFFPPSLQAESIVTAIQEESLRVDNDPDGRPLPLAGHWNTGVTVPAYTPEYQMRLLEQGHYIIPWFATPVPFDRSLRPEYYEATIKRAARLKLPIAFVGTQWERLLSYESEFYDRPIPVNPNVIHPDGTIERKVSPFGDITAWEQCGMLWGAHPMLRQIQEWYPDPPLILFISNNEHAKLRWTEVEKCAAYLQKYQPGLPDEQKRQIVADGWKPRYEALFEGIRKGLVSETWKKNIRFMGYNAFAPSFVGRWPGWLAHSLSTPTDVGPWSSIWQGASVSYYTNNWDGSTDCNLWSPQTEAMNWLVAREQLPKERPFWFEMSTWDGNSGKPDDKRTQYAKAGQTYGPERYVGMVQYGMWLLRPRTVREFRGHNETLDVTEPYFRPILAAVDRVHRTPVLREFWRKGELVANTSRPHPYETLLPKQFEGVPRWFRLDTDLDPKGKWTLHSELPVFALALKLGEKPERRWLLYAHAPLKMTPMVKVTIPEFLTARVDVPREGAFWLIDEKKKTIEQVRTVESAEGLPPREEKKG